MSMASLDLGDGREQYVPVKERPKMKPGPRAPTPRMTVGEALRDADAASYRGGAV